MIDDQRPLSIEKLLPKEFLLHIGAYLQTCAHIELIACSLIASLEHENPVSPEWFERYSQLRKLPTSELISALRHSAASSDFETELRSLCDWLTQYKSNRHIAAHGAFVASPAGFLRVGYVHNRGTRKRPEYQLERTAVTKPTVEEALRDAERILLVLMGILESIRKGLTQEVYRQAIPIVEHP